MEREGWGSEGGRKGRKHLCVKHKWCSTMLKNIMNSKESFIKLSQVLITKRAYKPIFKELFAKVKVSELIRRV